MHKRFNFVYSMIHKRLDYNLKTTKLTSTSERCITHDAQQKVLLLGDVTGSRERSELDVFFPPHQQSVARYA